MKKNDYILANLLNPDFSNQDFKEILDMNMENTQLLPYSSYTSSPIITQNEQFQDDGVFNERKFKDFYTQNVSKFATFNEDEPLLDNFEYSMFDSSRKTNSRVKDPNFRFNTISNPDRLSVGISGRNQIEKNKFSRSEIAQQSNIYDTEKGEWLDYSPNDVSLIKNPVGWIRQLFGEPLVKAVWNEEGDHEDPITKKIIHHQKGDLKLNNEGQYYYETLGGRSLVGKEVLSSFDILTVDGEGLDKYNFIDSDGLDKSVTGTVAKTVLTVAPLLFGGPVSTIYGGALVAREIGKSLPMLYGMISSLWGNEEDSKILNTIAAYGDKFTTGTSDYAKEHVFAFENIASLISDVATQYGQQRTIADSINKLRGSKKLVDEAYKKAEAFYDIEANSIRQGAITAARRGSMEGLSPLEYIGTAEKWYESALGKGAIKKFVEPAKKIAKRNARLGADASLVYMAIVSNTDVYQSMLEHGASKRDAAAVAFGSTLGMFAVDRYLGLGELFFDELRNDTRLALRNAFKNESAAVAKSLTEDGIVNPEVKQNALKSLIKRGINFSKGLTSKFANNIKDHATGLAGKAVGEGLEEVSEELVADLSKQIYEIAGEFSPNFINRSGITDVGAWENAKERYAMSFLGGSIGGGLFYGVDIYNNGTFKRDESKDELIYLIANNKTQEVLKELDKWKKSGKFGSKTLSASKYELNSEGKRVYLTADNEEDSQNSFIYNRIKESVLQLENILNTTGTNLSEDDLFKQMVMSEQRFMNLKSILQDQSYTTKYQEQFRTITRDLINAENSLRNANKTVDGTPDGQLLPDSPSSQVLNDPIRLSNIETLQQKVDELREKRDSFIKGEQSLPYTRKMLFYIDKYLNASFASMTYDTWLKNNKHKTIEQLTDAEKQAFKEEYLEYKRSNQALDLDTAFELYENLEPTINPEIAILSENASAFQTNHDVLMKLFEEDSPLVQYRTLARKIDRQNRIDLYNQQQLEELKNRVTSIIQEAGGYIDPATQRYIHNNFKIRRDDRASSIINSFIKQQQEGAENTYMRVLEVMKRIKPDMSNLNEVRDEAVNVVKRSYNSMKEKNRLLTPIMRGLIDMFDDFSYQYDPDNITSSTFFDFINNLVTNLNTEEVRDKFIELDRKAFYNSLLNSEDPLRDLLDYDKEGDSLLEYYLGEEEGENVDNAQWNKAFEEMSNNPNYNMSTYSEDELDQLIETSSAQDIDNIDRILTDLRDSVNNDTFIQLLDNVDSAVIYTNPITQLVKNLKISLDPENRSIEELLDALHRKSLGLDSLEDFTLTEDDENTIREAAQLLSTIRAYIYSAGTETSYAFPVGHNKVINEFAKKHSDIYKDFEELPTLDQSVANMYISEIDKYLNELSEDYPTSWISLSNVNRINKRQKFIRADENFVETKLEFFSIANRSEAMKFTYNGESFDLLEGIEMITDENSAVKLHKIENLFYINLHKAMNKGLTFEQILSESQMLEILTNINNISSQITSDLDETINYGKFTDFDKFVYLLTVSGISSNEFSNFIYDRIQESVNEQDQDKKIVPLTIQEHIQRIAISKIKSKDIYSQALNYVKNKTGDLKPLLDYFIFVDGGAGVGKTQVIAKNTVKYINSDNIWLSAPKETQINTLKEVIGKGQTKSKIDLFNLIIDSTTYQNLLQQIREGKENTDLYSTVLSPTDEEVKYQILNLDAITFSDISEVPELIVIDEITHFNGLELQILNEFAKRHNITILALGDTNQSGFTGISRNIDREKIIATRSPKLSISLRDVNLQKQENLLKVIHILNSMSKSEKSEPTYNQQFSNLVKLIRQLNFNVYNQDELNGDLIINQLTSQQANKLFGKVAFVGDTNGETHRILKENTNIEVIDLTPEEIQGQEFDYIVVDTNWNLNTSIDVQVFDFLSNLYTLMSRGRIGSIFIDNGLSNIIGQNKESFSQQLAPNLKEAFQPFVDAKMELLNLIGRIPNEEFERQFTTQEESSIESNTNEKGLTEDESLIENDDNETEEEAKQDRQDMQDLLGDNTEKVIKDAIDNIFLDPTFPIRIYGSAHFSGLRVEEETIDGKKVNVYVNPHSNIKSDLQIFTEEDRISEGSKIDSLVRNLLLLKSAIIFEEPFDILPSSITSMVDAEHLKKIKYKIEVRPKLETDNFVGFTGLQTNGPEGNRPDFNQGLVYTLIGEFEDNTGKPCKITLGLLANPDSYELFKKAGESDSDFESRKNKVSPKISRYKELFENITKKYNQDGEFYQDVIPQFSGLTHIRKTTGVGSQRRPIPVRSLAEYRKLHPYTVISDPYIFTGKNFRGLNASNIRGHAVVFVSNDTTLKPNELMQLYIEQKEAFLRESNPDLFNLSTKPKVRMLMLDPVGVSFRSLTYGGKMKKLYQTVQTVNGQKIVNIFPFMKDTTGTRMYVALWNYRANLKRFLDAYNDYNWTLSDGTILGNDDILRIARYADALYKKNHSTESELSDNVREILSGPKATDEELNLLQKFNDSLAYSVRQFRIGGSRKQSGVYLRNLSNISSDNVFYQGLQNNPIGIYITPEVAQNQYNLINILLSNTLGNVIELKDSEGNSWPETRLISPKSFEELPNGHKKGYNNSLAGLITKTFAGGEISVVEDGTEYILQLPNAKTFSAIPILLQKIYSKLRSYQNSPEDFEYENIKANEKGDNPIEVNYMPLTRMLKPSGIDYFDTSLDDMLALAFHGTTADPSSKGMRATDAYFKNGFYIDPMGAEVVGTSSSGQGLFKRCLTDENLFTVNVETDMSIFSVTLDNLEKAYTDSFNTQEEKKEDVVPQNIANFFISNTPNIIKNKIQNLISNAETLEDFVSNAISTLNTYYQKERIPKLINNKDTISTIMQQNWEILPELVNMSVQTYLERESGESFEGARFSWDEENILVSLPDGITHIKIGFDTISSNFTITKVIESQNETSSDKLTTAISYINEYLLDNKDSEDLDDLKSEYPEIYEEITRMNINSYKTYNDLIKAINVLYENSEYNSILENIQQLVASVNEGPIC